MSQTNLKGRLEQARRAANGGEVLQAEMQYLEILKTDPKEVEALATLAHIAMQRGDAPRGLDFQRRAIQANSKDPSLVLTYAEMLASIGNLPEAKTLVRSILAQVPDFAPAWLVLGMMHDGSGEQQLAQRAWFQALTRAQKVGQWIDDTNTPQHLLATIAYAAEQVRDGRRALFLSAYDDLRQALGVDKMQRVDRAVAAHMGELDAPPSDSLQRPKFFYFPGLPTSAYVDPFLQPWARQLQDAFPAIRAEALKVYAEEQRFENFLDLKDGTKVEDYLGGNGARPAWEAFFFYRHGQRFDANHARCPETSAVLESLELCRIADQAPEICYSVLTPGSHIKPHYGVTNTRLVMHLPLVVPEDCALNIVGAGEHAWKEGELMMFDDTFQHEAWNRSDKTRIVMLMDCWNPHLTQDEKTAVKQLVETISAFDRVETLLA